MNLRRKAGRLLLPLFAAIGSTSGAVEPLAELGNLNAFWRYSAALGPFLEGGQALTTIPDYLLESDFPYRPRLYPLEVPFADHLSIVRLLGGHDDRIRDKDDKGWATRDGVELFANDGGGVPTDPKIHDLDLAYRGENGKVALRADLLRAKLSPYLDNGYTDLTLVLDAMPYCFTETPHYGGFGNVAPPDDMEEWHGFVKLLAAELKRIMGEEAANKLRFRVGTEMNGLERFAGTQARYFEFYDHTAAALKEVLPGAEIGPFNNSGVSLKGVQQLHNVRFYELGEHCLRGPFSVPVAGTDGIPLDFFAFSRYFAPGDDPDRNTLTCKEVWDGYDGRFPERAPVSREIHEFGIATFRPEPGQFVSSEPGAFGAAQTFVMMMRLKQYGINRLWHWGVADKFRDQSNHLHEVYNGTAWLLSVLEYCAGGQAGLVFPETDSPLRTRHLCLVSSFPDKTYCVISAYNADFDCSEEERPAFLIPKMFFPAGAGTPEIVRLNRATSVHDNIRRDLETGGLLLESFKNQPNRVGGIREMADGRDGEILVGDYLHDYRELWQESLTLKPAGPDDATIESEGDFWRISARCAPPEIVVLVFRPL